MLQGSKRLSSLPPAYHPSRVTDQRSSPAPRHTAGTGAGGGTGGNGGEHFNVLGYQSKSPRGPAHRSPQQLTHFTWDRHSMWVEEPVDKRPPGGAQRSVLPTRYDPAMDTTMQQSLADDYEMERISQHEELWSQVILPAVTWLYGWVDWQINSKSRVHARMNQVV